MSMSEETADLQPGAPLSRAVLMTRRLIWLYGVYAALGVLMLVLAAFPIPRFQKLDGLGHEFLVGGMGEVALNAVLMALVASTAAGLLTNSRLAQRRTEAALSAGELDSGPPSLFALLWKLGPGVLARLAADRRFPQTYSSTIPVAHRNNPARLRDR
jgi:hypothetical protein